MRWLVLVLALLGLTVGCAEAPVHEVERIEHQVAPTPVESGWRTVSQGQSLPAPPASSHHHLRVHVGATPSDDAALLSLWGTPPAAAEVDGHWVEVGPMPRIVPLGHARAAILRLEARPGSVPHFHAGSQRALWVYALQREVPDLMVAGALVVTGLLLVVATLRSAAARAYRGLGVFLATLGVIIVMVLPVSRHLFVAGHAGRQFVHGSAKLLYPLGLLEFVLAVFGDTRRRLLFRGRLAYVLYALGALFAHLSRRISLSVSTLLVNVFTLYVSAVAIAAAIPRARAGDRAARTFLAGFVALVVIAMPDLLDGMGLIETTYQTLPWAILAFGVAMGTVIERRYDEAQVALAASHARLTEQLDELGVRNQEITALNAELRHQIVERTKQMADALQRVTAPPTGTGALHEGDLVGGRYRVVRPLGRGGMGAVFEVERTSDARRLALKVMATRPTPEAAARFAREAEIAARLVDPHLVGVVDVSGASSDRLYLVMELVEGTSLEDARPRFGDVAFALPTLRAVAEGLAALHRAGIVHRDLKPANVLLLARGGVKISDFGISAFSFDGDEDDVATPADGAAATLPAAAPGLTGTGMILGTPAYMAPELARGTRRARPSADVFALGVLAYELLAGVVPFVTPPIYAALAGATPPVPAPLPATVPSAVADLVLQSLAPTPDTRPTAEAWIAVLA